MSSQEFDPLLHGDPASLALACLEHLAQEEASLLATREALRQLHAALLHQGVEALARALPVQERAAQAAEAQHRKRMQAVQEWATFFGISPGHITLTMLADQAPDGLRARLEESRQRLRALALEVDQLNRENTGMVNYCMSFMQQVLGAITGTEAGGPRYGPAGAYQKTACGSLLSARG
jgi:hypothetical protein